jgi:uncharacterized protein YaaR (DUF327 family)
MISRKALFGYDSRKVQIHMNRMEREAGFLERRQREQSEAFLTRESELLRQIAEAGERLSGIETMEANLRQWIQRNQS